MNKKNVPQRRSNQGYSLPQSACTSSKNHAIFEAYLSFGACAKFGTSIKFGPSAKFRAKGQQISKQSLQFLSLPK